VVLRQNVLAAAEQYDLTLLSFAPTGAAPVLPPEFRERGVHLVTVPFHPPSRVAAAWRGLFGRWPYTLARYRSAAFERALRAEVARRRPAVAYVHHLHLATYFDALDGVPMVLREQNLEFAWMARYAREAGATPRGIYAGIQARRLLNAEVALARRSALVLTIQEGEARALRAVAPGARVETLPVAVDLDAFPPPSPVTPSVVLLAASFQWPPNVEGAIRFLREGWPRLRERAPGVRLRLAGKAPPARLRDACAAAGADLAADVPSMAAEYARAALLIVPLWVGGGARVKIVEAFAARLPVVATTVAAEGLDLEEGQHYARGETPVELADAAVALLDDVARRHSVAAAAHALTAARWSLAAVAALQARYLDSVASRG
jgi:glycosyltransferase involved in cell wall biosynthesis